MQLSDHFHLAEFTASRIAAENHIENKPTEAEITNLKRLSVWLEDARKIIGGRPLLITSGFRCEALNARVGGHPKSFHRLGLAADFVALQRPGAPTVSELFLTLAGHVRRGSLMHTAELFEEHLGRGSGWVHVAVRPLQPPTDLGRYRLSSTGRRIYTPLKPEETAWT